MKSLFTFGLIVLALFSLNRSFAHQDEMTHAKENQATETKAEEEGTSARFGPGLAVTAFDKEEGFQLSDKALKTLGVKFQKLHGGSSWQVPTAALVRLKQSQGVYRKVNGWISFVLVKVVSKNSGLSVIQSEDLQAEDEVAVSGAQFLRMTDADLNSNTVDNCAH